MQTILEDIKFIAQVILAFALFIGPMIAVEWEGIRCAFFNN